MDKLPILKNVKVFVHDGTKDNTPPAADAEGAETPTWTQLVGCVTKLPNFFPSRETKDYKPLDYDQAGKVQGQRPAIDGKIGVYPNDSFLEAYKKMVLSQKDTEKGSCFWLKVVYSEENDRTVQGRMTIDDHLPTSEGSLGDEINVELAITNIDEMLDSLDEEFED
jgi:hypothetical protein